MEDQKYEVFKFKVKETWAGNHYAVIYDSNGNQFGTNIAQTVADLIVMMQGAIQDYRPGVWPILEKWRE